MEPNERDEIVDEVRAARQTYAAQFNYDIRRMVEDLQAKEARHPELRADLHPLEANVQAEGERSFNSRQ